MKPNGLVFNQVACIVKLYLEKEESNQIKIG